MIYEYECKSCGCIKEIMHSMADTPTVLCGKMGCDGHRHDVPMIKIVSATRGVVRDGTPTYHKQHRADKNI